MSSLSNCQLQSNVKLNKTTPTLHQESKAPFSPVLKSARNSIILIFNGMAEAGAGEGA